jgi:hypothetical protein
VQGGDTRCLSLQLDILRTALHANTQVPRPHELVLGAPEFCLPFLSRPAMPIPRRFAPLLGVAAFVVVFFYRQITSDQPTWRDVPQVVGLGEMIPEPTESPTIPSYRPEQTSSKNLGGWDPLPSLRPGTPKPPGSNYTRTLVMPRMADENVDWVDEELPNIGKAIYIADDPSAPLHPPKNKGHEVMIYLTYIIDHYDDLPDVSIFMHAHRYSWHNNDLHNHDAVEMIKMLSSERVQRLGYMNMRCHWNPGCPEWMHPGVMEEDFNKQEETMMAKCWSELFPHEPIPRVLAVPCCAQFALSRDRIRTIPLSTFKFYRNWLLKTELSDYISGRIWEYIWQFVFTGQSSVCPTQHVCYCDGYGICFEGEADFDKWFEIRYNREQLQNQLAEWRDKAMAIENAKTKGRLDETAELEVPELGKDAQLEKEIEDLNHELSQRHDAAVERGGDPRVRALQSGREWKEGDGF